MTRHEFAKTFKNRITILTQEVQVFKEDKVNNGYSVKFKRYLVGGDIVDFLSNAQYYYCYGKMSFMEECIKSGNKYTLGNFKNHLINREITEKLKKVFSERELEELSKMTY